MQHKAVGVAEVFVSDPLPAAAELRVSLHLMLQHTKRSPASKHRVRLLEQAGEQLVVGQGRLPRLKMTQHCLARCIDNLLNPVASS